MNLLILVSPWLNNICHKQTKVLPYFWELNKTMFVHSQYPIQKRATDAEGGWSG